VKSTATRLPTGLRQDRAQFRQLDGSLVGRILVERKMSSYAVIVREVAGQNAPQVPFVEDEDMVQTLAPGGANEPLPSPSPPAAGRPPFAQGRPPFAPPP